jgi:UDP-glucose 4-epimerase
MVSKIKVSLLAGGAGFIGVNLIERLISEGRIVVVLDNMSRGQSVFVTQLDSYANGGIHVLVGDCSDRSFVQESFSFAQKLGQLDEVWHLAANSDIPAGVNDAGVDLKDTFLTTFELLHAMKLNEIKNLHFASSSAIYGDLGSAVLHENIGPLLPISNYGAMKLASEALASAAAESYLDRVNLFRFPNVVGVPATHGVILDFINKLLDTPNELQVLGDGTQQKAYLHVSDLVAAMLKIRARNIEKKIEVVNIGPIDDGVTVRWIAEQVVERVRPSAQIVFGKGNRGWVGDVPKFTYSTDRLQSYGWSPVLGSVQAILKAIDEIATQLDQ